MPGVRGSLAGRRLRLAAATSACLAVLGGTALAKFPQDAPNDPGYAPAEQGGPPTCLTTSVNSDQHYLYGFMPRCPALDSDPENAAGMSVDKAWRTYTTGRGDTVIAYIEAGINWHNGDAPELANRVFLNAGELPGPTTPVHDRVLTAEDFADTDDANENDIVDPEDIIVRFSDGVDDDRNGYTDDISGWDFYDRQNDPATVDSTYGHANGQMKQAAAETNNGIGDAGICPQCRLLPIKAGAEALDRTDDLAQAWLYAADMNADVLVSTTADLGYSTLMERAVERVWDKGTVMVESSNDFDSTDHQGGMFHQHVLPGNGMVTNTQGLDTVPGSAAVVNSLTTSYRERSGLTSWGTHNVFTVATNGGSTSESTPTVGGVVALTLAYGKEAAHKGLIDRPLSGAEAIQELISTASDVNDPSLGWPNHKGWDLQYGYGRPNVYRAMRAIEAGDVPPVGWIDSPKWFSLYDPTRRSSVPLGGHVEARRSRHYTYQVEFAPGAEPKEGAFMSAGSGSGSSAFDGRLGRIDLSRIPDSFWSKAFTASRTKTLETSEQYTVTIRLTVTDAKGRVGVDRRSIAVTHDPSWSPAFPKRIGPGGESQAALVDLQGRGHLAIVFGDSDGRLHAVDGKSGEELPGFPTHTMRNRLERPHRGIRPGHEPMLTSPAVGDLHGNGRLEILASTTTGRVYAWNDHGTLLRGWPKTLDRGVKPPPIPRPDLDFTRLPHQGATAPPVLYDLDGNGKLEVIQAAWNGFLYAWKPNGRSLDGWPVQVKLPASHVPPPGRPFVIQDHKLDTPPAIGDIDGDGSPELVIRSQYADQLDGGLQPLMVSHLHAYNANGSPVAGYPVELQALIGYYGSAQEFVTEGVSMPALGDVNGDGVDEIAMSPGIFSPTYLLNGDGSIRTIYGPVPDATADLLTGEASLDTLLEALDGNLPTDAPVSFTTFGTFGRFGPGNQLSYAAPMSGGASVAAALLLAGSGTAITNWETAYNGLTGLPLPGFPSRLQGLDFLGGPVIADVTGDGQTEIINGADSSAIQAYRSGGSQAPGFPKFTTGWVVFAPAVGDLDSNGTNELVALTREGYLMVWRTSGLPSGNQESWRSSRDEHNTMAYGNDTRPPGAIRNVQVDHRFRHVSFRAPGDDWYAGKVDYYKVRIVESQCGRVQLKTITIAANATAGGRETIEMPHGYVAISLYAVDDAGNRSRKRFVPTTCFPGA